MDSCYPLLPLASLPPSPLASLPPSPLPSSSLPSSPLSLPPFFPSLPPSPPSLLPLPPFFPSLPPSFFLSLPHTGGLTSVACSSTHQLLLRPTSPEGGLHQHSASVLDCVSLSHETHKLALCTALTGMHAHCYGKLL